MTDVELNQEVVNKVQRMLLAVADSVTLVKEGVFSVRHGSTRAFIEVRCRESFSWVRISVPVLLKVQQSPELLKYIAYNDDYIFGHLFLDDWDDGTTVMFAHSLLADYLDEAELAHALLGMASSADNLDDELKTRFGGVRFHDEG